MAKNRPTDTPTPPDPAPPADESITPAVQGDKAGPDESATLRARIAELEAELAKAKAPPPAPAPVDPNAPKRKFRGLVPHGRAMVVEAVDEIHAERAYKDAAGIIATEHKIAITPVADDVPVGPCA